MSGGEGGCGSCRTDGAGGSGAAAALLLLLARRSACLAAGECPGQVVAADLETRDGSVWRWASGACPRPRWRTSA
ncbi:hypothetical protein [Nannocystis pusilla]|uniref:hypothetical protein n=1 Tax=Nannocystis pusilla TaxID=889268 RepID=UPI003B7AE521